MNTSHSPHPVNSLEECRLLVLDYVKTEVSKLSRLQGLDRRTCVDETAPRRATEGGMCR